MDIQSFFTKERLTPSGFILLGLLTTLSILCLPVLIYFGVVHLPVIQTLCKVTNLLSVTQDLGNENFFIYLVDFNIGDQILSNVTMFQTRQNLTIGNFTNCFYNKYMPSTYVFKTDNGWTFWVYFTYFCIFVFLSFIFSFFFTYLPDGTVYTEFEDEKKKD